MSNFIKFFILIILLFALGCNNSYKPNNNTSNNNTNNNNTNNNIITNKSMYIKVKVNGESNNKAFLKYDNMYAKDIDFSINNKTYSYTADFNNGYYLCTYKTGNFIDTKKYIFDGKIQFDYKSNDKQKKLNGYIWIGNSSHLFFRNNIALTIPINLFDEAKYTNIALLTITLYPDNSSYTYTFDGFEPIK